VNIKKVIIIIAFIAAPYFFAIPSYAQQITLSFDPPIVETRIKPGKSILVAYTAENKGDPTPLQFLVRPFTPQGQTGSLSVGDTLEGPIIFSLENTDVAFEKPFFFKSNEKRQAVIKISVPEGIPEGDYYYMVLVETVPSLSVGGQTTGVASASIGSPLLISVTETGVTESKGVISQFSIEPTYLFTFGKKVFRIVDTGLPLPVVLSIRNIGRNMIDPQGSITIRGGGTTTSYELLPQHILSNSQRIVKTNPPQDNVPSSQTAYLSGLHLGKNTISASVSFGENTSLLFAQTDCIGIPVRLFSLLFVAFCVGGVVIFFAQKRRPIKG